MRFVRVSEQTDYNAIALQRNVPRKKRTSVVLYSMKRLVLTTETECLLRGTS
jgi:hypothetical protein